ncbi:HOP1 (YIL072W) [Zygosaccharomyces parabailii]|nr:HOP1 (YIL072W) [Zygosaccharomyces parabailii]
MSTRQLVQTKTNTKTDITTEQSQKLVQTMLTMSFGCLAFLRGLFPDESFVDQRFVPEKVEKNYSKQNASQTNSIKIKTLVRGKFTEVDMLLDWLEKGVFQAIKLKYLKALSLGIFLDEKDSANLSENYTFHFEYDVDNNVKLKVNDETSTISLLDSRKMAQQLMRRFIIITQSLEPLPQKKYLTVRLMFNEVTPPDYQPHLFKDASFDKAATIKIPAATDSAMFSVGSLDTKHHKLGMRVYSGADMNSEMGEDGGSEFTEIDPFDFVDEPYCGEIAMGSQLSQPSQSSQAAGQTQSQTTNMLGGFLKSPQSEIQPTQALCRGGGVGISTTAAAFNSSRRLACECGSDCFPDATKLKSCKSCKKRVHGICYGNHHGSCIEKCLLCLCGDSLQWESPEFQDLMMLRKCYRYLARTRTFPSPASSFIRQVSGDIELDQQIRDRFAFCVSVLLQDGILTVSGGARRKSTNYSSNQNPKSYAKVLIDVSSILTADQGELEEGNEYSFCFTYNSERSHACYMDITAQSKSQVEKWLAEITDLRNRSFSLPSSCNLQSLEITDSATQDALTIGLGQKRKHVNLDQYLEEENNSVMNDTLDITTAPAIVKTPNKIRKISVSKKTLRSIW